MYNNTKLHKNINFHLTAQTIHYADGLVSLNPFSIANVECPCHNTIKTNVQIHPVIKEGALLKLSP